MNREIKFRAWDGKEMKPAFDLSQNPKYWWEGNKDFPLMQYTGLKDKNGVEIYENDIIRVKTFGSDPDLFTTEVIYKHAAFSLKNRRNMFYIGQKDMTVMDDAVVIGNRFENPELLEVNK